MARQVMTREEFEGPYRHPYRHWVPRAWEMTKSRATLIGGLAAGAGFSGIAAASGQEGWAAVGALLNAGALGCVGYWTAKAAWVIRGLTRPWRRPSELRNLRERRPHRGEADPSIAHDEYAVSVEDHGELFLWCFRPLHIDSPHPDEDDDWVVVPGAPEYVARVLEATPYDPRDAGRAAEQLAEAQSAAASYEAAAAEDARRRHEAAQDELEIAAERRGTAAALQRITGQDPR